MLKTPKNQRQPTSIQKTSTFQYLIVLIVLTILNISFFFGYGSSNLQLQCSADTMIQVATLYLINNGKTTLASLMPPQCSSLSNNSENAIRSSVRHLIQECEHARETKHIEKRTEPLVTLFTTFAEHFHLGSEKSTVHHNTLVNWASFKPSVNLLLFSNSSYWTKVAKSFGWDVLKPLNENNGTKPPILKDMFRLAISRYQTKWYGYINADILLTTDLLKNLEMFTRRYNTSGSRLLLTGRRTNVGNLTNLNPSSEVSIKEHAEKYGQLFNEDAEDFFISTKSFPWQRIPPLVVGRPGYDNWLVAEARCRLNATVFDVTQTLLALHQTTKKEGNGEGHFHADSDYNLEVLKQNKKVPNFLAGLTDCIIFNTYRTFCNTFEIAKRTHLHTQCNCKIKK